MANFASRIRELRSRKGFTQAQMAAEFELSRRAWQLYETGKRTPTHSGLNKFADYFDVSVDFLLGRSDIVRDFDPDLDSYIDYSDDYDPSDGTEENLIFEVVSLAKNIKKSDEFLSCLENFVRDIGNLDDAFRQNIGHQYKYEKGVLFSTTAILEDLASLAKHVNEFWGWERFLPFVANFIKKTTALPKKRNMKNGELLSRIAIFIKLFLCILDKKDWGTDFMTAIVSGARHELKD